MSRNAERARKTRRKKKSKLGYYIYAITILILTIANIGIGMWLLTYVQKIEVKGNVISDESEIISWIKDDPMTVNSIYTLCKYRGDSYQRPIYVESVNVRLKAPWMVQVEVKEKQVIACVPEGRAYVYFDKEGLVLKKSTQYYGTVPVVEGIEMTNTGQFEYLQMKDEKAFSGIISIAEELSKNRMKPERIVWDEEGMNLYFNNIRIQLGTSRFDEKVVEIPPVLEKLEGKTGIVHMEHYTKGGIIRFEENTEES